MDSLSIANTLMRGTTSASGGTAASQQAAQPESKQAGAKADFASEVAGHGAQGQAAAPKKGGHKPPAGDDVKLALPGNLAGKLAEAADTEAEPAVAEDAVDTAADLASEEKAADLAPDDRSDAETKGVPPVPTLELDAAQPLPIPASATNETAPGATEETQLAPESRRVPEPRSANAPGQIQPQPKMADGPGMPEGLDADPSAPPPDAQVPAVAKAAGKPAIAAAVAPAAHAQWSNRAAELHSAQGLPASTAAPIGDAARQPRPTPTSQTKAAAPDATQASPGVSAAIGLAERSAMAHIGNASEIGGPTMTASPSTDALVVARHATSPQSPQLAARIAEQVVAQMTERQGNRIELRLDPPELGRMSVRLHPADGGVTAMLSIERPETEALLRQHAHLLERALGDAGFRQVSLGFGAQGQGREAGGQPGASAEHARSDHEGEGTRPDRLVVLAPTPGTAGLRGHLDIRL